MSRSGYSDDLDTWDLVKWRGQVASSIRGKRGQAFLRELALAMDAMPVKELIANELITPDGACCAIGVVCKARGIDVSEIDYDDTSQVGSAVGITHQLAAEIEYENDEGGGWSDDSPAERWTRMRKWVDRQIWDWKEVEEKTDVNKG